MGNVLVANREIREMSKLLFLSSLNLYLQIGSKLDPINWARPILIKLFTSGKETRWRYVPVFVSGSLVAASARGLDVLRILSFGALSVWSSLPLPSSPLL